MNKIKLLLLPIIALYCCCRPNTSAGQHNQPSDSVYSYQPRSVDGAGKLYKGREIALVMGFDCAEWLERSTREKEENVKLAIKNLPLTENSTVADIGAGTGYYTFRIAPLLPKGKVYAVELQDEAIAYLKKRSSVLPKHNVAVVKSGEQSCNLPKGSVDLAIMVDVYHELSFPHEYLQSVYQCLKPNGKLLLIEYRGEDDSVPIKKLHKMTVQQVNKELAANGFRLVKNKEFLSIQHYLIYQKDAGVNFPH